jgi:branched-chain amino acid aminotransferase
MDLQDIDVPELDWKNLPFSYIETDYNVRCYYKDGKWSEPELSEDSNISLHIASPCLHYGQQAFEGMKAFRTVNDKIVCFRPYENARRLQRTSSRIQMPEISEELFIKATRKVIEANSKFVPPYGTGASLYIRPLVIGTGAKVGLGPASEYVFVIFVNPVGPYYKGGFRPVKALVLEDFDRAAPSGIGDCKVGGNYAAGMPGSHYGHIKGYPIVLYLDSKEKKYIDEFATSNFIGIHSNSYITPASKSILPSITNESLSVLAEEMGMKIERRPVTIDEIENYSEIGAVGTAAVVTPVSEIAYRDKIFSYGEENEAGPVLTQLHDQYLKIQTGQIEDKYNWLMTI